jgi:hypothetical protein
MAYAADLQLSVMNGPAAGAKQLAICAGGGILRPVPVATEVL